MSETEDLISGATAKIKEYTTVDDAVVAGLVKYLGIALRSSKDASLVSCSDPVELERVRENFLKKKLGMTDSDADLDAAIKDICETMKDSRQKCRVTFCYLLAEKLGRMSDLT